MTRSLMPFTLLILLTATLPLLAQGTGGSLTCGHPLHIEVGLPDGMGGTTWSCQNPTPSSEGKLRIHAGEGTWAQLMPTVYIRNVNPGDPAMVQLEAALLSQFPWLTPPVPWDLSLVLGPPAGGLPPVDIAPANFWNNVFLPLWNLDPDDIKKFYQPIILGTNSSRIWQGSCPVWMNNPIVTSPHIDMSFLWRELLADTQQSLEVFDFFSLMQFATMVQGGASASVFLDSPTAMQDALQVGLHIKLQAILLKSGDPGLTVTNDEVTTDGLSGLDILVLPGLEVTDTVEITLTQGIPSSGLPGGPTVALVPTHHLTTGAWNMIPMRHYVAPCAVTFHMSNLPAFSIPVSYLSPGKAKIFVPPGMNLGLGYMDLVGPFGTRLGGINQPWSAVYLSNLNLNPLN